jgi:hypothetical protein
MNIKQWGRWGQSAGVVYFVFLLMITMTNNAWAAKTKTSTYNKVSISLDIVRHPGRPGESEDNPNLLPDLDASRNQIYEVGQHPMAWIEWSASHVTAKSAPKSKVYGSKGILITNTDEFSFLIQLVDPSGKTRTKFLKINSPTNGFPILLPGDPINAIGNYVVKLTVTAVSKDKQYITVQTRFMIVPKGFIGVRAVSSPQVTKAGVAQISCALATTNGTPLHLTNLKTKVTIFGRFERKDWRASGFKSIGNIIGLPDSCTLTSLPQQFVLNLAKTQWTPMAATSIETCGPGLQFSMQDLAKQSKVYHLYGQTYGTYNGLHWYRSWDMGEIKFK